MVFRMKYCSVLIVLFGGLFCLLTIYHMEKRIGVDHGSWHSSTNWSRKRILQATLVYEPQDSVSRKPFIPVSRNVSSLVNDVHTQPIIDTAPTSLYKKTVYDLVNTFLMFIGYPRSGTTIVGSILDAHPNIVIAHEYNLGRKWTSIENNLKNRKYIFDELIYNSRNHSLSGQRAKSSTHLIFNYHVPGLWQGKYKDCIKVIGDKKGGATTRVMYNDQGIFVNQLRKYLNLPVKFIHIIRNPFDNIATMAMRKLRVRGKVISQPAVKIRNDEALAGVIKTYFSLVRSNYEIRKKYGRLVLDIKYSRLVRNPRKIIKTICSFLSVTCEEDYLEACSRKIFVNETNTRRNFFWPKPLKERVYELMSHYSFLKGFSF